MKLILKVAIIAFSALLASCGHKKADKEPNPSIKANYQAQADFLLASLSSTNALGGAEYDFLATKITELRDLVPLNGIAKKCTLITWKRAVSGPLKVNPLLKLIVPMRGLFVLKLLL